jgi:hypothetical protein
MHKEGSLIKQSSQSIFSYMVVRCVKKEMCYEKHPIFKYFYCINDETIDHLEQLFETVSLQIKLI